MTENIVSVMCFSASGNELLGVGAFCCVKYQCNKSSTSGRGHSTKRMWCTAVVGLLLGVKFKVVEVEGKQRCVPQDTKIANVLVKFMEDAGRKLLAENTLADKAKLGARKVPVSAVLHALNPGYCECIHGDVQAVL